MQVEYERCAGIDLHKKTAVTTIMITQADGTVEEHTRTFSTMTSDLLALDDWLDGYGVQIVAMESTGIYWHPSGLQYLRRRAHHYSGECSAYES